MSSWDDTKRKALKMVCQFQLAILDADETTSRDFALRTTKGHVDEFLGNLKSLQQSPNPNSIVANVDLLCGMSHGVLSKAFQSMPALSKGEQPNGLCLDMINELKNLIDDFETALKKNAIDLATVVDVEPMEKNDEPMDQDELASEVENQEPVTPRKRRSSIIRIPLRNSLQANSARPRNLFGSQLALAEPSNGPHHVPTNRAHPPKLDARIFGEIADRIDADLINLIPALKNSMESMKDETDVMIFKEVHSVFERFIGVDKVKFWKDKVDTAYVVAKRVLKERGFCCGESKKLAIANIECDFPRAVGCRIRENNKFRTKWDGEKTFDLCVRHYDRAKNQKKNCTTPVDWSNMEEERHVSTQMEKLEQCTVCGKFWHEACRMSDIWEGSGAVVCRRENDIDERISSKDLGTCTLSEFIENGLDAFVTSTGEHCPHITIRVTSVKKVEFLYGVNLQKYLEKRGDNTSKADYLTKCIIAFQDVEIGKEAIIFGMIAQENESTGFTNVEWIDSNHYIGTEIKRDIIFQQIIAEYLKFTRLSGFRHAYICACPAPPQDDFLFNAHHPEQKYAKKNRLDSFYRTILDSLKEKNLIASYDNRFVRDNMSNDINNTLKAVLFFNAFRSENIESILGELLEKMDLNDPNFDEMFMEKLAKCEESYEHHFFYITFKKLAEGEAPKQELYRIGESQHLGTQTDILETQRSLGLEFKSLEKAVYATRKLVQIWKAKEDEKEEMLFGPNTWFH